MIPDDNQYIPKVIEIIERKHLVSIIIYWMRLLNNFLDKGVIISSEACVRLLS